MFFIWYLFRATEDKMKHEAKWLTNSVQDYLKCTKSSFRLSHFSILLMTHDDCYDDTRMCHNTGRELQQYAALTYLFVSTLDRSTPLWMKFLMWCECIIMSVSSCMPLPTICCGVGSLRALLLWIRRWVTETLFRYHWILRHAI